jgi:hypothetical protein
MPEDSHLGDRCPAPQGAAKEQASPSHHSALERHRRKCQICGHPELEAIEEDYRDWLNPREIARQYNLPPRALYRHFDAVGLASKRRQNLRRVLDRILERGLQAKVTGNTVIAAVRAQCCLTDDNHWVEPAKHVIRSTQNLIDTNRLETTATH